MSEEKNQRIRQVQRELLNVVERYAQESDLTVGEILGVLEIVKLTVWRALDSDSPRDPVDE